MIDNPQNKGMIYWIKYWCKHYCHSVHEIHRRFQLFHSRTGQVHTCLLSCFCYHHPSCGNTHLMIFYFIIFCLFCFNVLHIYIYIHTHIYIYILCVFMISFEFCSLFISQYNWHKSEASPGSLQYHKLLTVVHRLQHWSTQCCKWHAGAP